MGREAALVSDEPGTTRDLIEAPTTLAGLPVQLVDTAGLREDPQTVEALGIERVFARLGEVDLLLVVLDGSRALNAYEHQLPARLSGPTVLVVVNKSDLARRLSDDDLRQVYPNKTFVFVSAKNGAGLTELSAAVAHLFAAPALAQDALQIADARQAAALALAADRVRRVLAELEEGEGTPIELLCAELHEALGALDELLGLHTCDEILDAIFSRFCIGK